MAYVRDVISGRTRTLLAWVCLLLGVASLAWVVVSLFWFTTGEIEVSALRVGGLFFQAGNVVLFAYLASVLFRSGRGNP